MHAGQTLRTLQEAGGQCMEAEQATRNALAAARHRATHARLLTCLGGRALGCLGRRRRLLGRLLRAGKLLGALGAGRQLSGTLRRLAGCSAAGHNCGGLLGRGSALRSLAGCLHGGRGACSLGSLLRLLGRSRSLVGGRLRLGRAGRAASLLRHGSHLGDGSRGLLLRGQAGRRALLGRSGRGDGGGDGSDGLCSKACRETNRKTAHKLNGCNGTSWHFINSPCVQCCI